MSGSSGISTMLSGMVDKPIAPLSAPAAPAGTMDSAPNGATPTMPTSIASTSQGIPPQVGSQQGIGGK